MAALVDSLAHSKGAGPPGACALATAGGVSSRNCWVWVSGADTERVPGEMVATSVPTLTSWSFRTVRVARVLALPAVIVTVRLRSRGGVLVTVPSGAVT